MTPMEPVVLIRYWVRAHVCLSVCVCVCVCVCDVQLNRLVCLSSRRAQASPQSNIIQGKTFLILSAFDLFAICSSHVLECTYIYTHGNRLGDLTCVSRHIVTKANIIILLLRSNMRLERRDVLF